MISGVQCMISLKGYNIPFGKTATEQQAQQEK